MSRILIDDLNNTNELDQATSRAVLGGYYLQNNYSPSTPSGTIPVPYPNTGLMSNTRELAKGGILSAEITDVSMQPMISYW